MLFIYTLRILNAGASQRRVALRLLPDESPEESCATRGTINARVTSMGPLARTGVCRYLATSDKNSSLGDNRPKEKTKFPREDSITRKRYPATIIPLFSEPLRHFGRREIVIRWDSGFVVSVDDRIEGKKLSNGALSKFRVATPPLKNLISTW